MRGAPGFRPQILSVDPVVVRTPHTKYSTPPFSELRRHLDQLTAVANPALRAAKGIGTDTASILLIAAGDNPHRLPSEASFAALWGARRCKRPRARSPATASTAAATAQPTTRYGASRWSASPPTPTPTPAPTPTAARPKARPAATSSAASSATSPARSTPCSPTPHPATDTSDLRKLRQRAGVSLQHAADNLNTWPATISTIGRGTAPNHAVFLQ